LVVEADDPLDNLAEARLRMVRWAGPMAGPESLGVVRILIDSEPPIYVPRGFELDRDHWPVVGMQLPVNIDPADPGGFEVVWDEVPSMIQRAEANDPTLADPAGTLTRTMKAVMAAGVVGSGMSTPPDDAGAQAVAAQALAVEMHNDEYQPDHFQESMDKAAKAPAPAGRTRAVVLIAASEATDNQLRGDAVIYIKDRHGIHRAVLAVNIPGRPPYAVFKDKFKHPDGKGGLEGGGLPALVSTSDPNDVEVLWDELLSPRKQDRQTRNAALADRDARLAQFTSRAAEVASGPPPAPPAPNLLGAPQIPAEAREQMIRNAQIALRSVPAEMRSTIIEQYRLAGITIDENGNVTE
jgi:hypothetical protein